MAEKSLGKIWKLQVSAQGKEVQLNQHFEKLGEKGSDKGWSTGRKKSKWQISLIQLVDPFEAVSLLLVSIPKKNSSKPTCSQRVTTVHFWKGTTDAHCFGCSHSARCVSSLLYALTQLDQNAVLWRGGAQVVSQ